MRQLKLAVAVLSFLLSSALAGHAEDARKEPAPTVNPELKQDAVKQDAVKQEPSAATQTVAPAGDVKKDAGTVESKEKRVVAAVGADGVQKVTVTGGDFYFDPNHIVVKVNVPVQLLVKKAADSSWYIPHDIMVKAPEAGIDFKVSLKKDGQTVSFTPTKAGTYALYCDKKPPFGKSHKDRGMEGVIEVVE